MNNQPEIRTAADFVNWGLEVFQARIERRGLALTEAGASEFRSVYAESGAKAASHPLVFNRYWQTLHRVMREQGDLAVLAAEWGTSSEVGSGEVIASIRSHREVKACTILCPRACPPSALHSEKAA